MMMNLGARALAIALLGAFMLMAPAKADQRIDEARELVSQMAMAVKTAVEANYDTEEARITEVNKLLDTYFDFDGITRFSAGRYWKKATKEEQAEYMILFRNVLTGLAARQFDQLKGLNYTVTDAVSKGKKLVLVTGIMKDPTGAQADAVVSWRVSTVEGKAALIIDVEIENISMLITQQQENAAIIRKNSGKFSALIDVLRKTADEI
ncbi:MAG: MlaC/ttg2D family ABC transporter substrate-binding protein [Candidatus Puniceispirillaceae bacterium]